MSSVVIIGYGNVLRGDDGVGPLAACNLAKRLRDQPVTVIEAHQLLPEMAWLVSRAQLVVLIDAAFGAPAGQIQQQHLGPTTDWGSAKPSSVGHYLTAQQLLAICQALYGTFPEAFLITVVGSSFEIGEELSEAVKKVLPRLIDQVERIVRQHLSDKPPESINNGHTTNAPNAPCPLSNRR